MKSALLFLVSAAVAIAGFMPNVRVDREDDPDCGCSHPAVTLGPGTGSSQPLYVVFEDGELMVSRDVMFQKSTDAGRTWLPADVLVRRGYRGAYSPDITTDSAGNIYVVCNESNPDSVPDHRLSCMKSTDGGATWSQPTRVDDNTRGGPGWGRVAADSAGNLFCAWNDDRTGSLHIWSSVSTDRGATWSQNVRVDDDTTNADCYHADVFVQPGTNHYLVAASVPYYNGYWNQGSYLYRSTDMGQTFQPGVRLDTFGGGGSSSYTGQPHVVADAQHIICDYTDNAKSTEARTLYTQPDTWGVPHFVGTSYANGAKLAISADGRVHTALMARAGNYPFLSFYAFSSDHGVSWSNPEYVNDDTITDTDGLDIGVDSAGHYYIVWQAGSVQHGEIWLATNNPAAIAEQPVQPCVMRPTATIVRNVLFLPRDMTEIRSGISDRVPRPAFLDIGGRKLMDLKPGANDVSTLAPGVYFVREAASGERSAASIRKIVIQR
jgi:hypothetical protein